MGTELSAIFSYMPILHFAELISKTIKDSTLGTTQAPNRARQFLFNNTDCFQHSVIMVNLFHVPCCRSHLCG
jgi:hypothetical protein